MPADLADLLARTIALDPRARLSFADALTHSPISLLRLEPEGEHGLLPLHSTGISLVAILATGPKCALAASSNASCAR
jgi:hypothetical protein